MEKELRLQALNGDPDVLDQLLQLRGKQEKDRADKEKERADREKDRADREKQRADQEKQRADQEEQRADQLVVSRNRVLNFWRTDKTRYQQEMDKLFGRLQDFYASKQEVIAELQQLRSEVISKAFKRRSLFAMPCSTQCRMQGECI